MTLHSPHDGSDMAQFASRCGTDWAAIINIGPFGDARDRLLATVRQGLAPIDAIVNSPGRARAGQSADRRAGRRREKDAIRPLRHVGWH